MVSWLFQNLHLLIQQTDLPWAWHWTPPEPVDARGASTSRVVQRPRRHRMPQWPSAKASTWPEQKSIFGNDMMFVGKRVLATCHFCWDQCSKKLKPLLSQRSLRWVCSPAQQRGRPPILEGTRGPCSATLGLSPHMRSIPAQPKPQSYRIWHWGWTGEPA